MTSRETDRSDAQPDYVLRNRVAWDRFAPDYVEAGRRNWATAEPTWGIFSVAEATVGMLPDALAGKATIELGCGTAYVSAWLARRGARPVGIDNSPAQLATARQLQREFDLSFPLHLGNAERTPFPDQSFDLVISEYGASIWCDPYAWIPEAARLLRHGGALRFLTNGTLLMLCTGDDPDLPVGDRLERPYFGLHRFDWADDGSSEFHLGYGEWVRLLRANGFEIEDLVEIQPPPDATTSYPFVTIEWARRWPCEQVWKACKR
ncbi:MAG: class I SAM-dependent methyltransferase [Chloroflexota bacterium]|nr:class I SAM-dependent methyltransferase [Chloroflexota bacterium]